MFKFKDHLTVDSLDRVPAEYHGMFAKGQDGKFALIESAKPLALAYDGVNDQLGTVRTQHSQATGKQGELTGKINKVTALITKFAIENADANADPADVIESHINSLNEKIKGGKTHQVDLTRVQAQHATAVDEIKRTHATEMAKKDGALSRYLIGQQLTAAIAEVKGDTEFLPTFLSPNLRVLAEGDEYVVRVIDANGQPRTDGKGGWMSPKDLVAETKLNPKYGKFFESDANGGSGTKPGAAKTTHHAPNGGTKETDPMKRTAAENIAAALVAGQFTKAGGGNPII